MTRATPLLLLVAAVACQQQPQIKSRARSEAVASASTEMSGPSLLSAGVLMPALSALRDKAGGRWLRLEVRPREIILQAADAARPDAVVEYHYRDGKVGEPEPAALRGTGRLVDNLFDMSEVRLDAIPSLAQEARKRIDAEDGSVERVLVRRNLPESDDVRVRVYVSSPRSSGHLDADHDGSPL